MGFDYDPRDANNLIPDGEYDAVIKSVTSENEDGSPLRSKKSGEAMQKVTFTVYVGEGTRTLNSWFTAKSGLYRYRELAHALGRADDFSNRKFDAAKHVGDNLRLSIIEDGQYNSIEAFIQSGGAAAAPKAKPTGFPPAKPLDAEDIPF